MKPRYEPMIWAMMALTSVLPGCNSPLIRSQSPEADDVVTVDDSSTFEETGVRLVSDVAIAQGMNWVKIEGVGLITGLPNTGSDPPPSSMRTMLMGEMQSHEVRNSADILALPSTAMVNVWGFLPPGAQKGDTFDVQVRVPVNSKTITLESGWLMQTRLQEMLVLDSSVRSGSQAAIAAGDVVIDSLFKEGDEQVMSTRGRVMGGGRSMMSRPLGLAIRPQFASPHLSAKIGTAINTRFYRYVRGDKRGVATPLRDNVVEIAVHPRYKRNISRYMRVVRSIAISEVPADRGRRMELLTRKLAEPTTSAKAALELEAIGDEAIPILKKGLASPDPEVRFYSAEALAYLDESEAAPALAEAAQQEPAFRWHALTALAAMDHVSAYDALTELLHVDSVETRYGAFRAMRLRNKQDPLVKGEILERFGYHVFATTGPPLIHFSRSRRPEVVVFGHDVTMSPPAFLYAGKKIMLKGTRDGQIKVIRFAVTGDDETIICSTNVDELIRAIAKLGGDYPDVLEAIRTARDRGYLSTRVVVDALAQPSRVYYRDGRSDEADSSDEMRVANPIPEMFSIRNGDEGMPRRRASIDSPGDGPSDERGGAESKPGLFGRMTRRWTD